MTFSEWFYKVIIVQSVVIMLILLSLVALKYVSKDQFKKVQNFYQTIVTVDTDVNEVLKK